MPTREQEVNPAYPKCIRYWSPLDREGIIDRRFLKIAENINEAARTQGANPDFNFETPIRRLHSKTVDALPVELNEHAPRVLEFAFRCRGYRHARPTYSYEEKHALLPPRAPLRSTNVPEIGRNRAKTKCALYLYPGLF